MYSIEYYLKCLEYSFHHSLEWSPHYFHLNVTESVFWPNYVANGAKHEECDSTWEEAGYNGNYNELATYLHYTRQEDQRRNRERYGTVEDDLANIEICLLNPKVSVLNVGVDVSEGQVLNVVYRNAYH